MLIIGLQFLTGKKVDGGHPSDQNRKWWLAAIFTKAVCSLAQGGLATKKLQEGLHNMLTCVLDLVAGVVYILLWWALRNNFYKNKEGFSKKMWRLILIALAIFAGVVAFLVMGKRKPTSPIPSIMKQICAPLAAWFFWASTAGVYHREKRNKIFSKDNGESRGNWLVFLPLVVSFAVAAVFSFQGMSSGSGKNAATCNLVSSACGALFFFFWNKEYIANGKGKLLAAIALLVGGAAAGGTAFFVNTLSEGDTSEDSDLDLALASGYC
jgi:hypothetical protein